MKSGIYKIENIISKKCYIGQTGNFIKRQKEHFTSLKNNSHHSSRLQRAVNKHGIENFQFSILATCPSETFYLDKLEQFFINRKSEYNICKIVRSCRGVKRSKETREKLSIIAKNRIFSEQRKLKISIANKGRKYTRAVILNSKKDWICPVYQVCPKTLDVINKFELIKDAAEFIGCAPGNISRSLSDNTRFVVKGYAWCKVSDYSKSYMEKKRKIRSRTIYQYDSDMNFINVHLNGLDAAKSTGISNANISMALTGKTKTSGGFIWKYKENTL